MPKENQIDTEHLWDPLETSDSKPQPNSKKLKTISWEEWKKIPKIAKILTHEDKIEPINSFIEIPSLDSIKERYKKIDPNLANLWEPVEETIKDRNSSIEENSPRSTSSDMSYSTEWPPTPLYIDTPQSVTEEGKRFFPDLDPKDTINKTANKLPPIKNNSPKSFEPHDPNIEKSKYSLIDSLKSKHSIIPNSLPSIKLNKSNLNNSR